MTMQEMIQNARDEGLWLHSVYQDLWFSPDELENHQKNGIFNWGPSNWELRNPEELILEAEKEVVRAKESLARIRARVYGAND